MKQEIYEQFGLNKIEEEVSNRNAYMVITDKGKKCIKRRKYAKEEFDLMFQLFEHLYKNGFKNIPTYLKTIDKNKYYYKENENTYTICDWIESRCVDYANKEELKKSIEIIANFHQCAKGFYPDISSTHRIKYGNLIDNFKVKVEEIKEFIDLIKSKMELTKFDLIYNKYAEEFIEQGKEAIIDLENSNYIEIANESKKQGEVCHHDLANHNILISQSTGEYYLIDFDYCICDMNLHDLGSLIIRNMKENYWNVELASFILEKYDSYIQISKEQLEVLYGFIKFPKDFWQIGLQYYVEKQPWQEKVFLEKLRRILKIKEDRNIFIDRFRGDVIEGWRGRL